jgi:N-acetyl-anhydromuramyl-L-alanine amidase AmpD
MHMGPKKGYDDIGYHFMVDDNGNIYEGRYLAFKGSHVEKANTGKIGILVMGDFEHQMLDWDDEEPTTSQLNSVTSLIKILKSNFSRITKLGGHKDYKPSTECPGGELYKLIPGIRTDVGLSGP